MNKNSKLRVVTECGGFAIEIRTGKEKSSVGGFETRASAEEAARAMMARFWA